MGGALLLPVAGETPVRYRVCVSVSSDDQTMRLFNIEFLELFVRILFYMASRILQVCVCVSSDLKKMKFLNTEIGLNVLFVRI